MIEQDYAEVELQRYRNHWQSDYYYLGDSLLLESVNVSLSVEDIYQRVDNADVQAYLAQQQAESSKES